MKNNDTKLQKDRSWKIKIRTDQTESQKRNRCFEFKQKSINFQ